MGRLRVGRIGALGSLCTKLHRFAETETKTQISRDGGHEPQWRRDGRELFYISDDGKVMSVKIKSGPVFQAEAPEQYSRFNTFIRNPKGSLGLGGR